MARRLALAITAVIGLSTVCRAGTWQIDTVDGSAVGKYASMKVDRNGNVHLAYVSETYEHVLKYGYWDHTLKRWFTMPVAKRAGFCALALDSKQRPHISYSDSGSANDVNVWYAHWDGASWKAQPISVISGKIEYYTSIVIDQNDRPTISYYDVEGPGGIGYVLRLRTVSFNGNYWQARTVDEEPGSGKFNSMVIDPSGTVQLAYANVRAEHAGLRFAERIGQKWKIEKLEGAVDPYTVYSVALAVDKTGAPHISYTAPHERLIKYATKKDGKWTLEAVDRVAGVGFPDRNGIAVDADGNPYITYYDAGAGLMKLAYKQNSKWMTEIVDRNFSGYTSAVQVENGTIWIAYADEFGGALRCAHRPLNEQTAEGPPAAALTGSVRK